MAFLLLCSWVCGCATLSPGSRRENFEPVFLYSEDEPQEGKATDVLGPFFTYRKDTQGRDLAFRPFFYWKKEEGKYTLLEYLYPLGKYKKTDKEVESYFMPFFSTRRDLSGEDQEKKERGFLLAFWGETEKGESYGGFFPIYGTLKKRFGKDELNFFLWPIYSDSREGENRTYSVLWPIFSRTTGGGKEGFKVWPLMGHERKENHYEKLFFLWPIFHFEKRDLYTDNPTQIDMVFPLYVSSVSSKRVSRSVIWPFFNYTYDEEDHYTQWDFPWPFFQWAKGDDKSIFRIFPLYGYKYWEGQERGYVLWPLYWYDRQVEEGYRKVRNRYLLLSKDQTEVWENEGKRARILRIWPLFYYGLRKEGAVHFYFPALIPIDDEGFERNWGPLFRLYEYHRNPAGESESKFLWGFYVHRKNAMRELYELSFFLTYYSAEDLFYFSLAKGLVEYRAEGDKCALRLLYSPWPIEWGCPPASREDSSEPEDGGLDRKRETGG
jgi:hypothetical protein